MRLLPAEAMGGGGFPPTADKTMDQVAKASRFTAQGVRKPWLVPNWPGLSAHAADDCTDDHRCGIDQGTSRPAPAGCGRDGGAIRVIRLGPLSEIGVGNVELLVSSVGRW